MRPVVFLSVLFCLWACGAPAPNMPDLAPPMGFEDMDPPVKEQFQKLEAELQEATASGASAEEVAAAIGNLGKWFQAYRFLETAQVAYGAAVERAPEEPKWVYLLGRVRASLGDPVGAEAAFRRARELDPELPAAAVREAEALQAQGVSGEPVEALLERALELDGGCVRARVALAEERRRAGDPDRAVELLERALELQRVPEVRYYLGLAHRDRGDLKVAQELLEHARPGAKPEGFRMHDPYSAEVAAMDIGYVTAMRKARQDSTAKRFVGALNHYRRATAARPDMVEARLGEIRSLFALERLQQARVKVEKLLEEHPELPKAYYLAGRIHDGLEKGTGEPYYLRALELDPKLVPALMELGEKAWDRGEVEAALGYFERARSESPDHLEASTRYVRALAALGRRQEAEAAWKVSYERAEEKGPLLVLADELDLRIEGSSEP